MNSPCPHTALAQDYVAGQLAEPEQASFEEHYFACDACLAEVQRLQDVQQILSESPAITTAAPAVLPFEPRAGARGARQPPGWAIAVAASLVALAGTAGLWQLRKSSTVPVATVADAGPGAVAPALPAPVPAPVTTPQTPVAPPAAPVKPADPLGALALVVAPAYLPLTTRAPEDDNARAFAAAMADYSAARYPAAAIKLWRLTATASDPGAAFFFLGISELMTGNTTRAGDALRRSVALGQAPYADEAHFYLAKVALRQQDRAAAERELQAAVRSEAGPEGEARRLLRKLGELKTR